MTGIEPIIAALCIITKTPDYPDKERMMCVYSHIVAMEPLDPALCKQLILEVGGNLKENGIKAEPIADPACFIEPKVGPAG